jgi:hypothetical protein
MTAFAILPLAVGALGGLLVGMLITAAVTLEHHLHCVRLPFALHRRLKAEASREHTTVRALIVARLTERRP